MEKGEFALPWKMEMLKGPKIADIDYQMMARDAKCNTKLPIVPGVSHVKKCDWLVKNMTDWRLEVDLGQLNDWRRLAESMTGGGDFASALLFVTVSSPQHPQWSYSSYCGIMGGSSWDLLESPSSLLRFLGVVGPTSLEAVLAESWTLGAAVVFLLSSSPLVSKPAPISCRIRPITDVSQPVTGPWRTPPDSESVLLPTVGRSSMTSWKQHQCR